jgi:lipoxygenase homology domain-containing protein 1
MSRCAEVPYEVTFYTGDVSEAGTDSQVFIKAFGVKGSSTDIIIPKMADRFERSQVDLIKVIVFATNN